MTNNEAGGTMMSLDELVVAHYNELNESDFVIWNYIVNHKKDCMKMTIEELAKQCVVSRMTILRFTKKISLDGYSNLKFLLKEEEQNKQILRNEDIRSTCEHHMHSIRLLESFSMEKICEILFHANRCFVYGSGFLVKSSMQILKEEMFKTNLVFNILQGAGEMRTYLENIQENDVMVLYSISGEDEQTRLYIDELKQRKVKIIAFCPFQDSSIGKAVDINLNFAPFMTKENAGNSSMFPISMLIFSIELLYYRYCVYVQEHSDYESSMSS